MMMARTNDDAVVGLLGQLTRMAQAVTRRSTVVAADDLAQDTLARLLSSYGAGWVAQTPERTVAAVARRSLKNRFIDEVRRHRPSCDEVAVGRALDEGSDPEAAMVERELRRRLARALEGLGAEQREFLLEVMRNDSVPAAQRKVGWPASSPYYHLARLLERLRGELEG